MGIFIDGTTNKDMDYHNRAREELIAELQDLQQENRRLKLSKGIDLDRNLLSADKDKQEQINFSETKEHFELIFNTSPDAALITRLHDGIVVEVNDGYTKLTGFTSEETLGTSSIDINLWKNHEDRKLFVNELLTNGFCENSEAVFVRRDGSLLMGLISAKTFLLHGVPHIFSLVRDITERKLAEETMRQSEEKFRSLYANMIDGSALHTLIYNEQGIPEDYLINDVNPAFENLLGISKEKVINKTSREAYGVNSPPYFEIYSRVALTGQPEIFESYFAPLDKHFAISVYCPYKGSFATIFENITERKKAENENERTQKLLEDSQRMGKIGGWEINIDTMELKWTKEMYHIHEVDLTFKPIVDQRVNFYTSESLSVIDEAVKRSIEQGGSYEVDVEIITAKGNRKSIKTTGETDLKNRRIFGYFQDITERKKAEEALKRSEIELKRAQQITHIGSFNIDLITKQVIWTEELYKIYGFDPSLPPPLLNESQKLFTTESWEVLSNSIAYTVQTGLPYEIELITIREDGRNGWMWARGEAVNNNRGKITNIWGTVQDITDRKQAEAELKIKNEQLKELNATKDKFFSIIAHDLKSPFSGILGFSEMLRDEARNLDISTIEDYADIINSSAKQTYKLLENLLDWARMQQGGSHFEPKIISFNSLLKAEFEGLKYSADQKNIALVYASNEEINFTADEKMISSVLRNLISNAIKFTAKEGKINLEAKMKTDRVEVSISDTGIGMENENIEKLFKVETSFSSRGTENEKGTGLGLLLCKEFVERHGGSIWVVSEKGKGSKFTFSIPIRD